MAPLCESSWVTGASRALRPLGDHAPLRGLSLFVNFFQPSFKLAAKHRDGAKVTKRYHPPQTPCERLLASEHIPMGTKGKLQEISADLDP